MLWYNPNRISLSMISISRGWEVVASLVRWLTCSLPGILMWPRDQTKSTEQPVLLNAKMELRMEYTKVRGEKQWPRGLRPVRSHYRWHYFLGILAGGQEHEIRQSVRQCRRQRALFNIVVMNTGITNSAIYQEAINIEYVCTTECLKYGQKLAT